MRTLVLTLSLALAAPLAMAQIAHACGGAGKTAKQEKNDKKDPQAKGTSQSGKTKS